MVELIVPASHVNSVTEVKRNVLNPFLSTIQRQL